MSAADAESGFAFIRAINKFRSANDRTMADRAREARRAAGYEVRAPSPQPWNMTETDDDAEPGTPGGGGALDVWPLPGLAPMTRVRTSFGEVHAAALRKGDEVLTRKGHFRRIEWLNRIHLDAHILSSKPDTNPVVLSVGSLGGRLPFAEIMVSPRQVIMADTANGLEADVEAAKLLSRQGIRRLQETSLSYTMFHVGETAEILCEGLYLKFPIEA